MPLMIWTLLFSGLALANQPPYLPDLTGFVLGGLGQSATFTFTAGKLDSCTSKTASNWIIYQCAACESSAQVRGLGNSPYDNIVFEKAFVFLKSAQGIGRYNEFVIHGTAGEPMENSLKTPARLVLWYPLSNPSQIQWSLTLPAMGITQTIQARPDEPLFRQP